MAINALQVAWISRLAAKKIIREGDSILEFGPQDVLCARSVVEQYGRRHRDGRVVTKVLNEMYDDTDKPKPVVPSAFYSLFGTDRYRSLDLMDPRSDWLLDCNKPFVLPERFDVVTNFGTAEHVFNIAALFQSVHDALKPGGVALHVLPAFGDVDHGFYNIHPTTYLDLAAANNYEIDDLCYVDRWDIRNRTLEEDIVADFDFDSIPIQKEHLRDRARLQRMVAEMYVANFNHPKTQQYGPAFPGYVYDYCIVALRKTNDDPFRYPVQGYYGGGVAPTSPAAEPANSSRIRQFPLQRYARSLTSIKPMARGIVKSTVEALPPFAQRMLIQSLLKTTLRNFAWDVSGIDPGISAVDRWAPLVLRRPIYPSPLTNETLMAQMMDIVESRVERFSTTLGLGVKISDLDAGYRAKITRLLATNPAFVEFLRQRYWEADMALNRRGAVEAISDLIAPSTFENRMKPLETVLQNFSARAGEATKGLTVETAEAALDLLVSNLEDRLVKIHGYTGLVPSGLDKTAYDVLAGPMRRNPPLVGYLANRYLRIGEYYRYEKSPAHKLIINEILRLIVYPDFSIPKAAGDEIKEFAALVRNDLGEQPYPPGVQVSTRWHELVKRAMQVIGSLDDPIHIAILAMARLTFDAGMPILNGDDSAWRAQRLEYDRRHPELKAIGESKLALPGTGIDVSGVTYSENFGQGLSYYHEIFAGLGDDARADVVVEVGSGFGKLARILRMSGKTRCMVLVDLPESLALCFAFLKANFPDAPTHTIRSAADVTPDMSEKYAFIFCPIQQLDNLRLDSIDLLINTYSLGEMQQGSVDHILGRIHDTLKPKHFFSLNTIFTDKNLHFAESGNLGQGNEIVLKVDPEWWPLHMVLAARPEGMLYRNEVSVVLKRVEGDTDALVQRYLAAASSLQKGEPDWLMNMYFASLWTQDKAVIESLLEGLKLYHSAQHFTDWPTYDFEKIGEVKYLKRRMKDLDGA
jgi:putative sugar O-methyltransferase